MVIKTSFNWLLEWFQILGFRGEKYQRSQHLYPMVSWLVSTDHLDRNINIVFSVKARLFFFSKMRMQGRSKRYWRDKRRMAAKIRNHEGSSRNSRTAGWVSIWQRRQEWRNESETSFAAGRQIMIILCLQNPFNTSRPVSFLVSELCSLSPGGD